MAKLIQKPSRPTTKAGRSTAVGGIDSLLGPGGVRGSNIFTHDETLRDLLKRHDPQLLFRQEDQLNDFGSWIGSSVDSQAEYTATLAPPTLETWDQQGNLANRLHLNPLYLRCQHELYQRGFIALNYGDTPAPHLLTLAMGYLLSQVDLSLHLSAALGSTVAFALEHHAPADVRRHWQPGLLRRDGTALTASTWTSERDRADTDNRITTSARKNGPNYSLDGLKWFASNPDCDLAMVSAHQQAGDRGASGGLGLYLVPRRLDNGQLNHLLIRRLKQKLGTRGLATGEIELNDCWAQPLSLPPNGIPTLQATSTFSRMHAAIAAVASQRRTLLECLDLSSVHLRRSRHVTRQPMIQDQLLSMRCEYEANMELVLACAAGFDRSMKAPEQGAWQRLLVCLAKYRSAVCATEATSTGMEIFGSNGYIEGCIITRLHRDALMLKIWGGSSAQLAADILPLLSNRFDLRDRFGQYIRELLDQAPIRASRQSGGLRKALAEYQEVARYLDRFPEAGERIGPHLLELMADLLAGALLLGAAGNDLNLGDARRAMLLHSYLRRHFPDAGGHINIKSNEHLQYFEALITGTPIDVRSDWEKGLRNGL